MVGAASATPRLFDLGGDAVQGLRNGAMMGTILVPLFTHYRSPSPPVQAALAGGLLSIAGL